MALPTVRSIFSGFHRHDQFGVSHDETQASILEASKAQKERATKDPCRKSARGCPGTRASCGPPLSQSGR